MNAVNRVFRITDLVRLISKWKHLFEEVNDLTKLNNTPEFEHLMVHLFYFKENSGLLLRKNEERLSIKITLDTKPFIIVSVNIFEKYKKKPYFNDFMIVDMDDDPLINQQKVGKWILDDPILLCFFKE